MPLDGEDLDAKSLITASPSLAVTVPSATRTPTRQLALRATVPLASEDQPAPKTLTSVQRKGQPPPATTTVSA